MVFGNGEYKDYGGKEDDGDWLIMLLAMIIGGPIIGMIFLIIGTILDTIM